MAIRDDSFALLNDFFQPVDTARLAIPPVPLILAGTPADRVLAALSRIGEPTTLDRIAHLCDLSMVDARKEVQSLCAARTVCLRERKGHWRHSTWYEPVTLIAKREW